MITSPDETTDVDPLGRATPDESAPLGGAEYLTWVAQLNVEADNRNASLEQRGLVVVTTSGALSALLFGIVAWLTNAQSYRLPAATHGPLVLALVAFTIAAFFGLATSAPLPYKGTDVDADNLQAEWLRGRDFALRAICSTRVTQLGSAQKMNEWKARFLLLALIGEVVAIAALADAVYQVAHRA